MTGFGIRLGLGSRSSALFTPAAYGTLIAAYEADYGITLNGSTVAAWAPRWVAPGADAVALTWSQGTAVNQPLYRADRGDGRPEIHFDGTNDTLVCPALAGLVPTGTYSAALAGSAANNINTRLFNVGSGVGFEALFDIIRPSTGMLETWYIDAGGSRRCDVTVDSHTGRRSHLWQRVGTALTMRFGAAVGTGTAATATSPAATQASLGSYFGSLAHGACDISAVWVFGSAVSSLDDVIASIQARWPNYG